MEAEQQAGRARRADGRGPRPRAEREAAAVEIVFALLSGGLLAGLVFLAVASPTLFDGASDGWLRTAQWLGSWVFILRVVWVLVKWHERREAAPQPSQPGRTNPDS
ncbi:DUF6332 family protein [Streptomyces sp. DSM 42041]|uniref:DUF6332 family protein n=1 Tax=Streptomyces hazeniae TaxID=3075538 RepID=A0ABU2NW41_9ACTN|nr:DUF6332 family protein [Streptomyces sp. DSM 42041]MDT0381209.1 DUF6332 family protein [Streptomyces sp. DSM 42041]